MEGVYDPSRFTKAKVQHSPTLRYNNLSYGAESLCYTDDKEVHIVEHESIGSGGMARTAATATQEANQVYQCKFLTLNGTGYLVLATDTSIQVWDEYGNNILFNFSIPSTGAPQGDEALRSATFARGICSVRASDGSELLAVGASSGCVHVFDGSGFKFRHQHSTAREHAHAVSDLASHQDGRRSSSSSAQDEAHSGLLVSADDGGKIVVWRVDSCRDMAVQASVQDQDQSPLAALAVRDDRLVAAYACGVVRLYKLHTMTPWLELNAASRFLSSLALHPKRDVFAVGAEDGTLNVFTLPPVDQQVQSLLSVVWEDAMITGLAFCREGEGSVAAIAYDVDELRMWIAT